jgi:hypothetical protein
MIGEVLLTSKERRAMDQTEPEVTLEITCLRAPTRDGQFGLQDKNGRLYPAAQEADGSAVFHCQVRAKPAAAGGPPNFSGAFAHGTPQERFLYLSLRPADSPEAAWLKRIKVPLKSITWQQVEAAARHADARLACTVDGGGSGTVKLASGGWQVVGDES